MNESNKPLLLGDNIIRFVVETVMCALELWMEKAEVLKRFKVVAGLSEV